MIAPDADAKERVAAEVARYAQAPEGFASMDPMSRPGPMITPAELQHVAPLVNVPVKVENEARGFTPSAVEWQKDLALKPSDTRFAGKLPKPSAFEILVIGLLALIPALRLMRSMPMESFGSGGLFLHPTDRRDPERM